MLSVWWSKMIAYLRVSNQGLTPIEARFLANKNLQYISWLAKRLRVLSLIAIPLLILMTLLLYSHIPSLTMVATHTLLILAFAANRSLRRHLKVDPRAMVMFMQLIVAAGYAVMLHQALLGPPDYNQIAMLAALNMAILIANLILCPYLDDIILLPALIHVVFAVLATMSSPTLRFAHWGAVNFVISAFAVSMFYVRIYASRQDALGELATRDLLVETQKSRVETVERELAIASEIQDSFAPREELFTDHGMAVSFFQIKYDLLGGDWSAARTLPSGDLAVVVADATGKGIQAALVIHSIQTIWAEALHKPIFDPEEWMESANSTLLALGQRKEHTLSLGLMILGPDSLRYYSAGHVPLFLVHNKEGKRVVQFVVGRGNILGFVDDLSLTPQKVDLTGLDLDSVLLGTDGVFDLGIRTRKGDIVSLVERLKLQGAKALEECPALDDKMAVWVRKVAS